jgi:hypothetical protein
LSTVTVPFGGTGQTTLTSNGVLLGAGTGAVDTSKQAPSGNFVGTTDTQTLTNKTITDNTNDVTARSLFSNSGANTVSVFASANPTTGQVLTAVNGTTATWQSLSSTLSAGLGIDSSQLALNTIQLDTTARFTFSGNSLELSTVTVPFGGTGQTTLASNGVLLGAGTGAVNTSKQAPAGDFVGTTDTQTLTNKTITDNTNDVTARSLFSNNGTNTVSVFASANPAAGQVLTATSSTTATWQAFTSGLSAGLGIDSSQLALGTIQLDTTARFTFSGNSLELSTVTVPFGGTGQTTLASNGVLLGAGTSAVDTSKQAPSGDFVGTTDTQTLTNKTITDNTNDVTARSLFSNNGTNTVSVFASANPAAGQVLTATSSTTATWQFISSNLSAGLGIDNSQLALDTIQIDNTSRFIYSGNSLELSTVTVPFGGTGQTTLSSNGVLLGAGTSAVDTSKQAPSGDFVGTTDTQTLTNKTITNNTNDVTARSLFSNSGANTVSVFASANPAAGQVLTATGGTTATWQDISISNFSRIITVSQGAPNISPNWSTLQQARVDAISMSPTATNQILILMYPGDYSETIPIFVPSFVTISGQVENGDIGTVTIRPTAPASASQIISLNGEASIEGVTIDGYDGVSAYASFCIRSFPSSGETDYVSNVRCVNSVSSLILIAGNTIASDTFCIMNDVTCESDTTTTINAISISEARNVRGGNITIRGGASTLAQGIQITNDNTYVSFSDVLIENVNTGIRTNTSTSNSNRDYPFIRVSNLTFIDIAQNCVLFFIPGVMNLFNVTFTDNTGNFPNQLHINSENPSLPADPNKIVITSSTLRQDLIQLNNGASDNPAILMGDFFSVIPGEEKYVINNTLESENMFSGSGTAITENMIVFQNATNVTNQVALPAVDPFLCELATTGSIDITSAPATVDGVAPIAFFTRVLVKDGSTANPGTTSIDNGIYVWNGAGNPMTRAIDFTNSDEFFHETYFSIGNGGTVNFATRWKIDASTFTGNTIIVGTTSWGVEAYSTQAFQNPVVLGDNFYIGLTSDTFSGIELGITFPYQGVSTSTMQWQYWNGGSWTDFEIMSTLAEPNYRSNANQSFGNNETFAEYETIKFNHRFRIFDNWATTSVNGQSAYYIRANIINTSGVTTPIIQTVKIHRNYTKINSDGFVEFFGRARPLERMELHNTNSFKNNSYTQPDFVNNVNIANNIYALDPDITFGRYRNSSGVSANDFIINLPPNLDTSFPLYARINFFPTSNGDTGNVYLVCCYTTAGTEQNINNNSRTNTVVSTTTPVNSTVGTYQTTDVFELPVPTYNSQISGDPTSTAENFQTMFLMVLRDANNPADTATDDVLVFKVVIWYRIWTKGIYSYALYN